MMASVAPGWTLKKGDERWAVVETIRISPAPKLGGWAGQQLRFLSVSRGQSVITDLEQGSLAVNRRSAGLPSMQRMWFHGQGFSLGYTKPRASPEPAELFFLGPDARLWRRQRLPAAVIQASAGTDHWFVACRNGRVYAFSLDGAPQWNQLIPCARRDQASNEFWGLPIFHPRLHLAVEAGLLAVGAEQEFHRYQTSGERLWTEPLPAPESAERRIIPTDLPTRDQRLSRLGIRPTASRDQVRTGYLRLQLDTLLNAGLLKQVEVSDIETATEEAPSATTGIEIGIGFPFQPGISVLRTSFHSIVIGTQDGLVHVFDREGVLQRSFQVGETAVTDLLVNARGVKAAYCGGRMTLFERGRVTATTELPEYFAELEACGNSVLAWKSNSVWLIDNCGRVQLAAASDRPIRRVWGTATGFYVLTGAVASFQLRPVPASRKGEAR